ncbi:MAG: roadblock/LC7 domain-containing protein [Candidatus Methanoperedens sp.]|nr:roadblock/LC7 domain-containing protein [Candidatus Methanoperedens sp.]MCE8424760.1 roadblock/LC7 domain-containing protein [Candidatus Methanoperedens sp.]MCE8429580.1 roadblock/LC7 domain-containing protein [Candidatus Methanoperedens sp.]
MSDLYSRILLKLRNIDGVKMTALGSRDGFLFSENENDEIEKMTLMSSAMIKAAETVTNELDKTGPVHVIVDFNGGKLIAASAGPKALISVMAEQNASIDPIIGEIDRTASKIQEIL